MVRTGVLYAFDQGSIPCTPICGKKVNGSVMKARSLFHPVAPRDRGVMVAHRIWDAEEAFKSHDFDHRDVVQFGRTLASGARGCTFKSCHSDSRKKEEEKKR